MKKLHTLAIDDHAVVLEGYHYMFKNLEHDYDDLKFVKAHDCQSGYAAINSHIDDPFDIALIDYSLPPFAERNLFSGEDIALVLRHEMPHCKIIMMTMHRQLDIIASILHNVAPEGFINKSDCSTDELITGFKEVLNGNRFYSKTIADYLDRKRNGIMLDEVDVRIVLLLAKGIKNKNLPNYIPLSVSAIEKRKYKIKRLLGVDGGDEDLIKEARIQGYI